VTLAEVEALMQDLNRHIGDETQILFGTSVDGRMGNRLAVTIISSLAADGAVVQKPLFEAPASVLAPTLTPEIIEPAPVPEPHVASQPVASFTGEIFIDQELTPVSPPPPERPLQTIEAVLPTSDPIEEESIAAARAEPEPAAIEPPPVIPAPVTPAAPAMSEPQPAQPRVILPKKKPLGESPAKAERSVAKQEVMQFESVTRGRFEKSEPTIVEGQDLDVPTFLRKNVRVK
jgi:cell division protein FtsZ